MVWCIKIKFAVNIIYNVDLLEITTKRQKQKVHSLMKTNQFNNPTKSYIKSIGNSKSKTTEDRNDAKWITQMRIGLKQMQKLQNKTVQDETMGLLVPTLSYNNIQL